MKHTDCKNYINIDCEKGMCALTKAILPIDGEGSDACPKFKPAAKCGNCAFFKNPDSHGMGRCVGLEKEDWAYSSCGACGCEGFQLK